MDIGNCAELVSIDSIHRLANDRLNHLESQIVKDMHYAMMVGSTYKSNEEIPDDLDTNPMHSYDKDSYVWCLRAYRWVCAAGVDTIDTYKGMYHIGGIRKTGYDYNMALTPSIGTLCPENMFPLVHNGLAKIRKEADKVLDDTSYLHYQLAIVEIAFGYIRDESDLFEDEDDRNKNFDTYFSDKYAEDIAAEHADGIARGNTP